MTKKKIQKKPKPVTITPVPDSEPIKKAIEFCKILPKKKSHLISQYNYFSNTEIKEIIEQYEMFIQLLLQNYLFMTRQNIRIEIKNLLEKINLEKMQSLFMQGLRSFDVFLVDFKYGNSFLNTLKSYLSLRINSPGLRLDISEKEKAITFQIAPQISVLQSPALESLNLINQAIHKNLPVVKKMSLLSELGPLFQKKYIPVFGVENKVKSSVKFTCMDDALLLMGLMKYTSKNLSTIQQFFLMHKSIDEIRNRFKNLTRFKSVRNPIKILKTLEIAPLTELEEKNFEKGKLWFGFNNYHLIARYFLPGRHESFLRAHDLRNEKLLGKRSNCYFEMQDENTDSFVWDQKSDYIAETADEKKDNFEFMEFLKEFTAKNGNARKLLKEKPDNDFSFFTINLSDNRIVIGNKEKSEKNLFFMNKHSGFNTKIKILDDKLFLSNHKMNEDKSQNKTEFLNSGFDQMKRVKGFQTNEMVTKRLCPSAKELNEISARFMKTGESSVVENSVYRKLVFPTDAMLI